jgi:hypothetical protein
VTAAGDACASERPGATAVARAYGVPVAGGTESTEDRRSRVARGRPNWWVILAVSLALMALLVAAAGTTPHRPSRRVGLTATTADGARRPEGVTRGTTPRSAPTTTSTTTTHPSAPGAGAPVTSARTSGTALLSNHLAPSGTAGPAATTTTTTTVPPVPTTTSTSTPSVSQPADRTQSEGYLDPPVQTSAAFVFNGNGAMEVSVVWSGTTYLTMNVTCPNGTQNVGGTSAMAASLANASGSCRASVSEPASENATLTFTITIGPAGG